MSFKIGKNCKIHPSVIINVIEGELGDGATINENARIEGSKVIIGRECFIDRGATIGGGSAFDPQAELIAGDWLHMGVNSHINIARGVYIGHEFGCGIDTKIFTHGAYIDGYNLGAPIQWNAVHIGDNVWMPNAWVNPGVRIGSNIVVAARSLVNIDLPSGCLAGGTPAKVLKLNYLPQNVNKHALVQQIREQTELRFNSVNQNTKADVIFLLESNQITVKINNLKTVFDLKQKTITGDEIIYSAILKDQLRRNGIRFRYEMTNDNWNSWKA
jgi:acetyltransferase-like isoleucine patch superfamily enzyme